MKNILAITPDEVVEVYSGRPGCGCGCRGKYSSNPAHKDLADKNRGYAMDNASLRSVKIILSKVQAAEIAQPGSVEEQAASVIGGYNIYALETETRYLWVYALKNEGRN